MPEDHEAASPVDDQLSAIAVLHEPLRRSLYSYVAGRGADVSRDEAARAVGIQRSLAAFHLDKLVDAGLLEATFRRLSGRSGPGAGRPAKLYRRSARQHQVSLPPRRYELAAELLAEAVDEAGDRPAHASAAEVARRHGRRLGQELVAGLSARASRARRMATLSDGLERHGYEPRRESGALVPGNCPFHALAQSHSDLVCGMNLALLEGVIEGMGATDLEARRDPRPGQCCVTVSATRRT
jgi:predicted ArsR family transcriptional regulator